MSDTKKFINSIKKAHFLFSRLADGSITSVSSSVTTLLGYDRREFARLFPSGQHLRIRSGSPDQHVTAVFQDIEPTRYEIQVTHKNGTDRWLTITELPVLNEAGEIKAYDCIAHDVTNHKHRTSRMQDTEKMLRRALGKGIRTLAATVESRDYFSFGHHQRASSMARIIAQELGISAQRTDTIRLASVIHDIGKIGIPPEILNKRSRLSETEYGFVQGHPGSGYNILKKIGLDWPLAEIVLQHHERLDGSGYPNRLVADKILPEARILAVADVMEAMSSDRAHRPAVAVDLIVDELNRQKGVLLDADVVDASLRLLAEKKIVL